MPAGFLPVVLLVLLLVVAFQVIFSFNRDLFRAGAYKELGRKALPLAALVLMAATLPLVQTASAEWVPVAWAVGLGGGIILANFFSMPAMERRASRHFRRGRYDAAAREFRELAEQKPLARYYAFLGAALGASDEKREGDTEKPAPKGGKGGSGISQTLQESIDASTKAVELDPHYGIAYYNRALIQQKAGRRSKAARDMQRALESDLPRRFRGAAKRYLEQK
jgi:tetratricopeptide (TPR) repeat protein